MNNEYPVTVPKSDWGSITADCVETPCKGNGSSSYSPDSDLESVDLCDIVYIQSDAVSDLYYHALPKEALQSPWEDWNDEFNYSKPAKEVIERLITWKQDGSGSDAAVLHEELIKDTFPIENPIRKKHRLDEIDSVHHLEKEDLFLRHLNEMSEAYLNHHYSDRFSIYRGCTFFLPEIAKKLFERPNRTRFQIETSVVVNFSISRTIAEQYHPVNLELDIQPGDVAIAVDHILWDYWLKDKHEPPSTGEYRYRDGEIQLFGDQAASVTTKSIQFVGASKPLAELISQIPEGEQLDDIEASSLEDFTERDHSAIAVCIREMAKNGTIVDGKKAKQRLRNWHVILSQKQPEKQFEIETWDNTIEMDMEQLAEDIENTTGLPTKDPNETMLDLFSEDQGI